MLNPLHILPLTIEQARNYRDAANRRVAELTKALRTAQDLRPTGLVELYERRVTIVSLRTAVAVAQNEAEHYAREVERLAIGAAP